MMDGMVDRVAVEVVDRVITLGEVVCAVVVPLEAGKQVDAVVMVVPVRQFVGLLN